MSRDRYNAFSMKIEGTKEGFIKRWWEKVEELRKLREGSTKNNERFHELNGRIKELINCINELEMWEIKEK